MVERHIVSPYLIKEQQVSGLILSEDETTSIMINEDHLHVKVLQGV